MLTLKSRLKVKLSIVHCTNIDLMVIHVHLVVYLVTQLVAIASILMLLAVQASNSCHLVEFRLKLTTYNHIYIYIFVMMKSFSG